MLFQWLYFPQCLLLAQQNNQRPFAVEKNLKRKIFQKFTATNKTKELNKFTFY